MPAPIAFSPVFWTALRFGAVAAVALAARYKTSQPKDAEHEHVLDTLPEGVRAAPHRTDAESAVLGNGRFRRVIRLGRGPGIEIDAAALGRVRLRRLG